jgi:hypothetical protein
VSERPQEDAAAGFARLEGYLMGRAAVREAQEAGRQFARTLTRLGPGEQHEVADRFARHHLALRREILLTVTGRTRELRAEYSSRYDLLRRRSLPAGTGLLRPHRTAAVMERAAGRGQARVAARRLSAPVRVDRLRASRAWPRPW